jgi:hypothetical protein
MSTILSSSVVDLLSEKDSGLSIPEISRALGKPAAKIHSVLKTLLSEAKHNLSFSEESGLYSFLSAPAENVAAPAPSPETANSSSSRSMGPTQQLVAALERDNKVAFSMIMESITPSPTELSVNASLDALEAGNQITGKMITGLAEKIYTKSASFDSEDALSLLSALEIESVSSLKNRRKDAKSSKPKKPVKSSKSVKSSKPVKSSKAAKSPEASEQLSREERATELQSKRIATLYKHAANPLFKLIHAIQLEHGDITVVIAVEESKDRGLPYRRTAIAKMLNSLADEGFAVNTQKRGKSVVYKIPPRFMKELEELYKPRVEESTAPSSSGGDADSGGLLEHPALRFSGAKAKAKSSISMPSVRGKAATDKAAAKPVDKVSQNVPKVNSESQDQSAASAITKSDSPQISAEESEISLADSGKNIREKLELLKVIGPEIVTYLDQLESEVKKWRQLSKTFMDAATNLSDDTSSIS